MSSNQVLAPFNQIPDIDGDSLESGYVYVGIAGLNPEVNPIPVFWDEALSVPAAQPIRTLGGFLSRNGSPGRLYTDAATFSITIRNKNNSLVSSDLSVSRGISAGIVTASDGASGSLWTTVQGFIDRLISSVGAAYIGFISGLSGAVARTAQDKMRDQVSVFDFMTAAQIADVQAGTQVYDMTAVLNTASASCLVSHQNLFIPYGVYKLTSTWFIDQINVECEDAVYTKIQCVGSFTAIRIMAGSCRFKNFNVWFSPNVTSAAIGFKFGDSSVAGHNTFVRNIVENLKVRYAYTGFYNSSDMWGNVFTQMSADLCINGYDFTSNPSGTTNSFRNIYALGISTTGTMNSGSNDIVVASTTNLINGATVAVIGAGASGGPLITTISSVVGTTVTLAAAASTSVVGALFYVKGKGFHTVNFSDTHVYNLYLDQYASFGSATSAIVYSADNYFAADAIRFEACAVIGNNFGMIDMRAGYTQIDLVQNLAHVVDVGAGSTGYVYRCGAGTLTNHKLGDVQIVGILKYSSGTLKKAFLSSDDTLTITGRTITQSDYSDNGWEGGCFRSNISGRVVTSAPTNGSWDLSESYIVRSPVGGNSPGGTCSTAGTFGVLNSGLTTCDTIAGSSLITLNSASGGLSRNKFITITGVSGRFKIVDIQTQPIITALLSAPVGTTVTGAAVAFAAPAFIRTLGLELIGSTAYDPPSIAAAGSTTTTVSVTGASLGDFCEASFSISLAGLSISAYVSAANVVTVTFTNNTAGAIDLVSGALRVRVVKP
jgi:hypothetical protein